MISVAFYSEPRCRGWGHRTRCKVLADEFSRLDVCCSTLDMRDADRANIKIVDFPDISRSAIRTLRNSCDLLVMLTPPDNVRMMADLVFYQGRTNRPRRLDWLSFCGEWFEGPEWVILRPEFAQMEQLPNQCKRAPRVVICGGGTDPHGIADRVAGELLDHYSVKIARDVEHHKMPEFLAWADVAVVSYGMIAFECLAMGLPTIAISISDEHAESANLVQTETGGALCHYTLDALRNTPEFLCYMISWRAAERTQLARRAREYVDGRGVYRVAEKILGTLEDKKDELDQ